MRNNFFVSARRFFPLAFLLLAIASGCGSPATTEDFKKMATSSNPIEREQAAYGLIKNYRSDMFSLVNDLLLDPDISVRRAALRNIAETKDRRYISVLKQFISSSDALDRQLAAEQTALLEKNAKP